MCLLCTSCIVQPLDEGSHRDAYHLTTVSSDLCSIPSKYVVMSMEHATRVDRFMRLDDEQKASQEYADISYNFNSSSYSIGSVAIVTPCRHHLSDEGASWTVMLSNGLGFNLKRLSDRWQVTPLEGISYDQVSGLREDCQMSFKTEIFQSVDETSLSCWSLSFKGEYIEDERYSAKFYSAAEGLKAYRAYNSYGQSDSYHIEISTSLVGRSDVDFYVNGSKTDWCQITWNGAFLEAHTSQGEYNTSRFYLE